MSKADYDSGNGFLTKIWGPAQWMLIHIISLNYPVKPTKEHKDQYYQFIMSLLNVLPCGACRKNAKKNIKRVKFTKSKSLKNRESFSRWAYDFHKEVNTMMNKPTEQTFEEMRDMYEMFRAKCGKPKKHIEKGCTKPLNHVKTKCILSIIPQSTKTKSSLFIDNRCYPEEESSGSDTNDEYLSD